MSTVLEKVYYIHVRKADTEGYSFRVFYGRRVSNHFGGSEEFKTKPDAVGFIRKVLAGWGNPAPNNVHFRCETAEISREDLFNGCSHCGKLLGAGEGE